MPDADTPDASRLLDRLRADGLITSDDVTATPLTGGVSSEIYRIDDADRCFVVKQALAQLKVKAQWFADVSRNKYEQQYFQYVEAFAPEGVPRVLDSGDGYFTMEHLGSGYQSWKQNMLDGRFDPIVAKQAGTLLARIHRQSQGDRTAEQTFSTDKNFYELRVEPYLIATAQAIEPQDGSAAAALRTEADRLLRHHEALVHGDYSPKNMMVGHGRFVALDAEVAWYGDPAFDLAFCLTHLLLKPLYHHPAPSSQAHACATAFCEAYAETRAQKTSDQADLANRVGRLLRMIVLARIDGKSPVEYLNESKRSYTRRWALSTGLSAEMDATTVITRWFDALNQTKELEPS